MSITLQLKTRKNGRVVVLPLGIVDDLRAQKLSDADIAAQLIKSIDAANKANSVHDLHWLRTLAEWAAPDGTPTKHSGKWAYMNVKFSEMDDEADEIELNPVQVDTLWARISGDEGFKFFNGNPPAWSAFVMDFQRATGKHFADEDPAIAESWAAQKKEASDSTP